MTVVAAWTRGAEGWAALDRAAQEARLRGTGLTVVGDLPAEVLSRLMSVADGVPVSTGAVGGDLGEHLIDASYQEDVEMIVVGMRRRSPIGKMLVGDLAQRILLEAHCPVLAVKPPAGAAD
ncbi:universal stress protein [Catenuloplanes japonicus]|uniref:universal stress protein n=1 Tax=Catenuloplanes japonicus TaxID=33876 RepID=UPI000525AF61|nr:universal stress protein [Catenuloplanes japonicus]